MQTASKPIEIDLRRDLPKVRRHLPKLLKLLPERAQDYTAPCVIGVMVSPAKREVMEDTAGTVSTLVRKGVVSAQRDQVRNLDALQTAYDSGDTKKFMRSLARLEAEYLPVTKA